MAVDKQPPKFSFYIIMAKAKGFQPIDLQAELASKTKQGKSRANVSAQKAAKVQRAIYFPADIDNALQELAFEERTKITPLVIEAVRLLLVDRGKQ